MPKISEAKKNARRQRFIEAARRCLAKPQKVNGRILIRDILEETGHSSGGFYQYFKNLDECIRAALGMDASEPAPEDRVDVVAEKDIGSDAQTVLSSHVIPLVVRECPDGTWRAEAVDFPGTTVVRLTRASAIRSLKAHALREIARDIEDGAAGDDPQEVTISFKEVA